MCFLIDGHCEIWNESYPVARKEHRCSECHQRILVGTRYQYVFSVFEGDAATFKTCWRCMRLRGAIGIVEKAHGCQDTSYESTTPCMGELWSAIQGYDWMQKREIGLAFKEVWAKETSDA